MARARSHRLSFAKIPEVQDIPDLLGIQRESFDAFLESGLKQMFEEVSPIEDFTGNLALELTDHRFEEPTMTIEEAKERDSNYARPLFVTARFVNKQTGEIISQFQTAQSLTNQPVVDDGWIYCTTSEGKMVAFDTKNKQLTGWSVWGGNASHNPTFK